MFGSIGKVFKKVAGVATKIAKPVATFMSGPWAPLVNAGFELIGGALDRSSANRQIAQSNAYQREFAQSGIRWRVEDAKAAGLHPLYALGGPGASYTPPPVTVGAGDSFARAGQHLASAAARQQTASERALTNAQLATLQAQANRDNAQAAYYASEAARAAQTARSAAPMPEVLSAPVSVSRRGVPDRVSSVPDEVVSPRSGAKHVSAGTHPFWQEVQYGDGRTILIPRGDNPAEALESIPWWYLPEMLRANISHYGRKTKPSVVSRAKKRMPAASHGGAFIGYRPIRRN